MQSLFVLCLSIRSNYFSFLHWHYSNYAESFPQRYFAGFPTHTWTDEEVAKIKKYAAERKANPVNDDDIHAGFEMRFPTHTWTNEEVEDIKSFAKDVQNDDDIHAGLEMRFPTHTNTEEEIHQMESEEAKSKTEKVLNNFFK